MQYDTIIIGGGPGGLAAAYALTNQHVLVVENDLWGGTCPNRGCDPKKMLYAGVQARDAATRLFGYGIRGDVAIDWPALMAHKRGYTEHVPDGTLSGLKAAHIDTVHGQAHFIDPHTIAVGDETYQAEHIVIATGRTPVRPDIPGAELLATSTDFLDLDTLPETMAFIGASYVSIELANIAAVSGVSVTIIGHSDRILRDFPEAATTELRPLIADSGINFVPNVSVTSVTQRGNQVQLRADDFELTVDMAVTAMGRRPNVADLDLDAAGITMDKDGIHVDDHLQTTATHVYAIGDVNHKPQPKLTPVASYEGQYVAKQILGAQEPISYPVIPSILFGPTELAQVGVSLAAATAAPERYTITVNDTTTWYTYNRVRDPHAKVWTIVDKTNDHIVGAVVLASIAEELINTLTQAIDQQLTPEKATTIYAYPSPQSDLSYLF